MWAIKKLSGNQAGQIFPIKEGKNLIGRSAHCQIRFNDLDVSKEHAVIHFENNRLVVQDNQSRNGTYLNGVMINKAILKKGDKVSFNQTICDVIQFPNVDQRSLTVAQGINHGVNSPGISQASAMPGINFQQSSNHQINSAIMNGNFGNSLGIETRVKKGFFQRYFEEVLMPGVFYLGQIMEFKLVIGLFMLVFAVLVTALSTIPMLAITSDSIQIESRRRALTIARNLANVNQQALLKDIESAVSTQTADLEEGVSLALIVRQADGSVIAPANKAGTIPTLPFIEKARREQKELIQQLDSSHIAVSVPLAAFNPETTTYSVQAHAVVVYDMGSLAVDDGRTLSLFFQTLIIALSLGFILYYLFYRFIEHPIAELNKQMDMVLKNKTDPTVTLDLDFPVLQALLSNINTMLTRVGNSENNENAIVYNKDLEVLNIIRLVGYASLAITSDFNIIGINQAAENLLGITDGQLRNQQITLIPDQALQKSLYDLMDIATRDTAVPSKNELEFGGENTEVNCQAITDKGKVAYFIVTIIPLGGSS